MRMLRYGMALIAMLVVTVTANASPAAAATQYFVFHSGNTVASGKCLDFKTSNSRVQMYTCNSTVNQSWYIQNTSTHARVILHSKNNGQCVDAWQGANVQLVAIGCDGTTTQQWNLHVVSGGYDIWESVAFPGKCMDIHTVGSGIITQLYTCNNTGSQLWYPIPA